MRRTGHLLSALPAAVACLRFRSPAWRRVACLAAACPAAACLPAVAPAAPTVRLRAALRPEIPGHSTTAYFDLRIAPGTDLVPPPLIEANVRYPAGLDMTLSGLGIDGCSIATIELMGPQGCPPDSLMGVGHAIAELPIKHEVFREAARIAIVRTVEHEGHLAMLLCIYDETAVDAQILLPSQLLPAARPFGGTLNIQVPLVPSLPEAPDLSVAEVQLALGPSSLVYRERVHGRYVSYRPAGIPLPRRCPRGGYPFAVQLRFLGGARASSATVVPCPRRSKA